MKKLILCLIFLGLFVVFVHAQDSVFYYAGSGKKIYLKKENKVKFIYFANVAVAKNESLYNRLKSYKVEVETWSPLIWKISGDFTQKSISDLLFKEKNRDDILYFSDMLLYEGSFMQWESDEIIVKIFPYTQLSNLLDDNRIPYKEFKRLGSNPQNYLVKLDVSSQSAIEYANMLVENKAVASAQPSFWKLNMGLNPFFSSQWGLHNTGQYDGVSGMDIRATEAWILANGQGIKVAVIDNGIDLTHPDLVNNLLPGYDATDGADGATNGGYGGAATIGGIYCDLEDAHGTACAGIIAACDNDKGVKGVAYNAKIIPIRIAYSQDNISCSWRYYDAWTVDGLFRAWYTYGADILSNSWYWGSQNDAIEDEIIAAQTQGRGGKGCVVVFASGNYNINAMNVDYPARLSNVIAVGAISPCGERKSLISCDLESWGSNYGDSLDIVAPGVLVATTDIHGGAGYNPNKPLHIIDYGNKITSDFSDQDYTVWFNGTSAACPHVAGVAALVLSAKPSLTAQQVRKIIESTARKVRSDLYPYATITGRPNGTWYEQMGYGLVDAYAAVHAAICVNDFINQPPITTNTTVIGCDNLNVQGVTVTNSAKLTLDATGTTTIINNFEVVLGSELEIK